MTCPGCYGDKKFAHNGKHMDEPAGEKKSYEELYAEVQELNAKLKYVRRCRSFVVVVRR